MRGTPTFSSRNSFAVQFCTSTSPRSYLRNQTLLWYLLIEMHSSVKVSKLVEQKLPKDFFCLSKKLPPKETNLKNLYPKVHLTKHCTFSLSKRVKKKSASQSLVCLPQPATNAILNNLVCHQKELVNEEPNFTEDSLLGLSEFIPIVKSQKPFKEHTKNPFIFLTTKNKRKIFLKRLSNINRSEEEKKPCAEKKEGMLILRKECSRRVIRVMQDYKEVSFGIINI